LSEILDRADIQDAVRERILAGDTTAFFKTLEMIRGKPRQALEVNQDAQVVIRWQT
jgi:hypothetical protein